jgi:hypothetical protein
MLLRNRSDFIGVAGAQREEAIEIGFDGDNYKLCGGDLL